MRSALLILLIPLLCGCRDRVPVSGAGERPSPSPQVSQMETSAVHNFTVSPVSDQVFARMKGKSFPEGCTVPREDLRYLSVWHVGFDGEPHQGELVVAREIAQEVLEIFQELFAAGYKIEKVRLIDDYDAIDERSMGDNNSSAFCFRCISGTKKLSKHALGRAVDINPLYNPYVVPGRAVEPANGEPYVDRTGEDWRFIRRGDLCFEAFARRGFTWGGDWKSCKDYQHFEK